MKNQILACCFALFLFHPISSFAQSDSAVSPMEFINGFIESLKMKNEKMILEHSANFKEIEKMFLEFDLPDSIKTNTKENFYPELIENQASHDELILESFRYFILRIDTVCLKNLNYQSHSLELNYLPNMKLLMSEMELICSCNNKIRTFHFTLIKFRNTWKIVQHMSLKEN